jgi:hypothetical protein
MNHGQQRITCPKCRSNNFVGQPQCWNCGASLPPPEALSPSPPVIRQQSAQEYPTVAQRPTPIAQFPTPNAHQPYTRAPSQSPRLLGLRIALWVILILPALLAAGWYAKTRTTGNAIDAQKDAAIKMQEELMKGLDERIKASKEQPPGTNELDPSSPEAQARRELKTIYEKTGVGAPPPTDAEGNVHLQGGGTVTREQWEKARESLGRK